MVGLTTSLSSPAYAIYFDYRRQSDPEFRRSLKRDNRRMARAVKQENEAQGARQMAAIRQAVDDARKEGFPAGVEEKEQMFMRELATGESLCSDSKVLCVTVFITGCC